MTLAGTINPDQSEPGSYSDEGVLHISQSYRTGALLSDAVFVHNQDTYYWGT